MSARKLHRGRMSRFFRSLCDVFLRFIRARAGDSFVRRRLLEQAGVAAVDSVRTVPGTSRGRRLLVRIRIAEGCDARAVSRDAAEALLRNSPVREIRVLASGSDSRRHGALTR